MKKVYEPTEEELERLSGPALEILSRIPGLFKGGEIPDVSILINKFPKPGGGLFSKALLQRVYRYLVKKGRISIDKRIVKALQVKRVRTVSGVAPVAVLTRPHPCPGQCVFCPSEPGLPKSYLAGEPGAMRAISKGYDPYLQTRDRIETLERNGHPVDKIELLVLGGTWSAYPPSYREYFLKRCLEAMNGKPSDSLEDAVLENETARRKCVGLVIETRPDAASPAEIRRLRREGVTKIQTGVQALDDGILERNRCGNTVEGIRKGISMFRSAGFKIVAHWMPNLLGSTPDRDKEDFKRLFDDPGVRPDELKIYPCSLIKSAKLVEYFERGEWEPYAEETLVELIASCKAYVPEYCRINRIFRDIPSHDIMVGCRTPNLRQVVGRYMEEKGMRCKCIRCREVREEAPARSGELVVHDYSYRVLPGEEHFISMSTGEGKLAGFLRLFLPGEAGRSHFDSGIPEIREAAIIREVHVYGRALVLGDRDEDAAQHKGIGTRLLRVAEETAGKKGFEKMAVISAIGTREWYRKRGYRLEGTYMTRSI